MLKPGVLNLYHVEIRGAGTPLVQSLTSYICAVAVAHKRSPTSLLRSISRYGGTSLECLISHLAGTDGAIINGYGLIQTRVLAALSRASGRSDLMQTCLGQLGPAFASKGGRAVKVHRHWCPQCYWDMRNADIEAYDFLLCQLVELKICPEHLTTLHSQCSHCGAHQLTLPLKGTLDSCGACGTWLGSASPSDLIEDQESWAYQHWLVKELKQLLVVRDQVAPVLTGSEFSKFLCELFRVRDIPRNEIANQARIPSDTLRQWTKKRHHPTIASFLRASANLGISPANILLDPELAAHQLQFPFASATVYKTSRGAPRKRHDQESIRKAIAEQLSLQKPTVRGVKDLAEIIDVPFSMMYFHDPDGCKKLSGKMRGLRLRKRLKQKKILRKSAQRVLTRLDREGQPLTRRLFASMISERTKCSVRSAKNHFPQALDNYLRLRPEPSEGD